MDPSPGYDVTAVGIHSELRRQPRPELGVRAHLRTEKKGRYGPPLPLGCIPQDTGFQVPRILRHAEDALRPHFAGELTGEEPVTRFGGDIVPRLVPRRGREIRHAYPPLRSAGVHGDGTGPHNADGPWRGRFSGSAEGGEEQLGEEKGSKAIRGEMQLVSLFRYATDRGQGDAGVVPEDIELGLLTLEVFSCGFDGAEVIEREGEIFELAGGSRIVHRKFYSFDALLGFGLGAPSNVDFAAGTE